MTRPAEGTALTLGQVPAAPGGRPTLEEIAALQQGAADYLEAGRLPEAQALVLHALQLAPELPESLQLAGMVARRAGRLVEALELLDRALARFPRLVNAHVERGMVLHALGRPDEALAAHRQAITLLPAGPVAWCQLGHALLALSRPDEAVRAYREALTRRADYAEAQLALGRALARAGDHAEALAALELASLMAPDDAVTQEALGVALRQAGRLPEAVEMLRRAVALDPLLPGATCQLGVALADAGAFDEAATVLQAAFSLAPESPEAHNAMGRVRQALGYLDQALAAYRQALAFRPDFAEAHLNVAALLDELGRPVEALASCRASLTFRPDHPAAYRRMSRVLRRLERGSEAVATCRRALTLDPAPAEAWAELGDALRAEGFHVEAIRAYDEALAREPALATAHYQRGLARLALGDYVGGWEDYAWRWQLPGAGRQARPFTVAQWDGATLAGRTILVHAEGTPAEALQFARFLPRLAEQGARVLLECPGAHRRLLEAMPCVAQAVAAGDPLPPFDTHIPLEELPHYLPDAAADPAEPVPYLPTRIWSSRVPLVPAGAGIRVGLAVGTDGHDGRLSPVVLAQLLETTGVTWYLLDDAPLPLGEAAPPAASLQRLAPMVRDSADLAPLLDQLDLVISADAVTSHLAGGLGVPLWAVAGPEPDWSIGGDGQRSGWYPTARVFPRAHGAEWVAVQEELLQVATAVPGHGD